MRFLPKLVIILLASCNVYAQSPAEPSTFSGIPPSELVLAWLHSPDPRIQAWAAHDILVAHATDLITDLKAQLERVAPAGLDDASRLANFRTTLAMLDTLIQLDATLPAVSLERIEKLGYNSQTEELVLLSRLPQDEAESVIRSFYRPGNSGNYTASRVAAQMLARHPPKGWVAEFLSSIVITVHVVVTDENSYAGLGPGVAAIGCGGSGPMPSDWPEIGRYAFQDPPKDHRALPSNETLFLSAPDPVYLLRSVSRTYYPEVCGGFSGLSDAIRSHVVGTLLNGTPESPFPEQLVTLHITFHSRDAYRDQIQAFVDEQQQNFNEVAARLTSLDLLTEEERQATNLRINLALQDLRNHPDQDLPTLTFRPPIQWVPAS